MKEQGARAKVLYQALRAQGFERDRSVTSSYRFVGHLEAVQRTISVALTFQNLEFTCLPKVALLKPEREAPHVVAHLGASGDLCFGRNEDIVLDRYDIGGTVLMCVEMARRGLERALTHKHLEAEIAQEFPQHWLGEWFYFDISAANSGRANLYRVGFRGGTERLLLCDQDDVPRRLLQSEDHKDGMLSRPFPVFVFSSERDLTFGRSFRQPTSLAQFLDWLESILPRSRDKALKELTAQFPNHLFSGLFVSAPNACVGIKIDISSALRRAAQRRPALDRIVRDRAKKLTLTRFSGMRIDMPFILGRNMIKQQTLAGRRIVIVGCGTIGSHLAKFVVQSGAGHDGGTLYLVDNQSLEPGNVGRHYLGTPYIGNMKSSGLKQQLTQEFPDANILSFETDAERKLDTMAVCDLVVDATGEEALSYSINEHFVKQRALGVGPDVLHIWLFGNGAAAQALLVDRENFACYKCLKPDIDGTWRFSPLRANVKTTHVPAACGESQYVAYGVAAPAMAAALALQIAIDWSSGNPSPRLRTVRVDRKETIQVASKNPSRSRRCPSCGNRSS